MSSDGQHGEGPAIRLDGVGKCYEIYDRPIHRLKQTLYRGRRRFFREFWALRGVSFEVARGESLGIVGRNGSGKSTLLQIIAGTLQPTEGSVAVSGRVTALLELGSGFNYEFTGRENVFLNGAILGVSQREMAERFDEIASFADIGEFIDRPVKTYSTGMALRLAFAVQVLLDPEILIVDEALSVGDAAFQIKCMRRMRALVERGVSVLFVSHDVNSVRMLCDRALWLETGEVRQLGPAADVTARYMQKLVGGETLEAGASAAAAREGRRNGAVASREPGAETSPAVEELPALALRRDLVRWGSGEVQIEAARVTPTDGAAVFEHGGGILIELDAVVLSELGGRELGFGFSLRNTKGLDIITHTTWEAGERFVGLEVGQRLRLSFTLENILAPGDYAVVLAAEEILGRERRYIDFVENAEIVRVIADREVFSCVLPPVQQRVRVLSSCALRGG